MLAGQFDRTASQRETGRLRAPSVLKHLQIPVWKTKPRKKYHENAIILNTAGCHTGTWLKQKVAAQSPSQLEMAVERQKGHWGAVGPKPHSIREPPAEALSFLWGKKRNKTVFLCPCKIKGVQWNRASGIKGLFKYVDDFHCYKVNICFQMEALYLVEFCLQKQMGNTRTFYIGNEITTLRCHQNLEISAQTHIHTHIQIKKCSTSSC